MTTFDAAAIRQALAAQDLFQALPAPVFEEIVARCRAIPLAHGEILFHQGDPADRFFLVHSGAVKLARSSRDGQEKVIHLNSPGDVFAEAVMFMDEKRYPVTAQALEPSTVIAIPSRPYRDALRDSPETALHLLADLSRRLHGRLQDIDRLTLQQAEPRVCQYILAQLPGTPEAGATAHLPAAKQVIASRLSITPETLSRILHALADAGVIEVNGRAIRVLDPAALMRR